MRTELPHGARGKYSTYMHIIVNLLTYKALMELICNDEATEILEMTPYYTDINKLVLSDYSIIELLLKEYNLLI